MNDIFLGLGANLGDRITHLKAAFEALRAHATIAKHSSVYESKPHGVGRDQPLYLNMVIQGTTELAPRALLAAVKKIEQDLGRMPQTHNEPRPIDIDILMYGDQIIGDEDLVIPHREMHTRAFVLVPLEEIASFHVHPKLRKPVIDLLDELGAYDELVWPAEEQL